MKKLIISLIIAILIAGTVFAQPIREQRNPMSRERIEQLRDVPQSRNNRMREDNSVKIEGTLKLEKGFVAVENSGTVYYVPMLNRYIGFITGLKEGARVSVEGYEFRSMIQPTKVTIDGKSYDFPGWDRGRGPGFGMQNFQYSDDYRRAPGQRWNNQRNGNRNGRGSRCCQ
jgi:hypothetical protein